MKTIREAAFVVLSFISLSNFMASIEFGSAVLFFKSLILCVIAYAIMPDTISSSEDIDNTIP